MVNLDQEIISGEKLLSSEKPLYMGPNILPPVVAIPLMPFIYAPGSNNLLKPIMPLSKNYFYSRQVVTLFNIILLPFLTSGSKKIEMNQSKVISSPRLPVVYQGNVIKLSVPEKLTPTIQLPPIINL